jgi:transcriptional regulator
MYVPIHFREERREVMLEAMRAHPLATIVSHGMDGMIGSHLPLIAQIEGTDLVLEGHFARANPHCAVIESGAPTLVIFQGPAAYVSPSWYPSKKEHGKAVPTWNYISVHASGAVEVMRDAAWLHAHVSALSDHFEQGRAEPWATSDAPPAYMDQMLRAIVGFRIRVTSLHGKWKLSQNRSDADRNGVLEGLAQETRPQSAAVAKAMHTHGKVN